MGVIKFELVSPHAKPPQKMTECSFGYDLAAWQGASFGPEFGPIAVDTGIRFHMDWPDYIELKARSSMFMQGILVHPGVIDPDVEDTVKILVGNLTGKHLVIRTGTRLAQFILGPHQTLEPLTHYEDAYWSQDLPRKRIGGLGSTGE